MQTQAIINNATGELTLRLPVSFPPGTPVMVVMIQPVMTTVSAPRKARQPLKFGRYPVGLVDDTFTFRREELYARDPN
jgi:hypothetical protein